MSAPGQFLLALDTARPRRRLHELRSWGGETHTDDETGRSPFPCPRPSLRPDRRSATGWTFPMSPRFASPAPTPTSHYLAIQDCLPSWTRPSVSKSKAPSNMSRRSNEHTLSTSAQESSCRRALRRRPATVCASIGGGRLGLGHGKQSGPGQIGCGGVAGEALGDGLSTGDPPPVEALDECESGRVWIVVPTPL